MQISKPKNLDEGLYFKALIDKVSEEDLLVALEKSLNFTQELALRIPISKEGYAYEKGKWTIKQVLQHLVDCERVFNYRAMSIARGEKGNMLGFDENVYAINDSSQSRSMSEIVKELEVVRRSTIALFSSFNTDQLNQEGTANGLPLSPRIIGWFCAAHNYHHVEVIRSRYL